MNVTLTTGYKIGNYQVKAFIKKYGLDNAESYIVVDEDGVEAIMKLIVQGCACVEFSEDMLDAMKKDITFPGLIRRGSETIDGVDYYYVIREKVHGERLSEILDRGVLYLWDKAVPLVLQIMGALKTLHEMSPSILHNDLTPSNIIINGDKATLIGLGHASYRMFGNSRFATKDLNPWYLAPETRRKRFSERTDIFSAGVILYRMLMGIEPWRKAGQEFTSFDKLKEQRTRPVLELLDSFWGQSLTMDKKKVLCNMLAPDCDKRFTSVDEAMKALYETITEPDVEEHDGLSEENVEALTEFLEEDSDEVRGFAGVAGLDNVKSLLSDEVMFVLKDPVKAKQYRLRTPNGMLFYGPPGCGKTFIAEKFAQESNLNFMMIKASDLGSIYIHGTQGKISELFEEASRRTPTVICFDEMDAMVPDRSKINNDGYAGEVNEFLAQLNNCSKKGILVIGTTNRPNMIDPAVLRSGRMDHLIYIPMPDFEARKELFRLYLADRPLAEDVDVDTLANESQGYVASDIELIVNKSALLAAKADEPISHQMILDRISATRRSVSEKDAATYEDMRQQMEQKARKQPKKIGFVTGN